MGNKMTSVSAENTAAHDYRLQSNFAFSTLICSVVFQPLGACDYLEMARLFDTMFIRDVPMLTLTLKDQARRFTTLIDNFYDKKVYVRLDFFFLLRDLTVSDRLKQFSVSKQC